jgi:3-methyladenine DNA glycosylase/8-oxoguanine DNA glycosylase
MTPANKGINRCYRQVQRPSYKIKLGLPKVYEKKLNLPVPKDFSFWRTVLSHGWCMLAPFSLDRERRVLRRILKTHRQSVYIEMRAKDPDRLEILARSRQPIFSADSHEILSQVITMLRLDESMQDFYQALSTASDDGALGWIPEARAGRLLRSPSLFEDIAKMICTTNCSWSATERMVQNLVQKLGTRFDEEEACFPNPEELAAASEDFLIKEARTGYRSAYLIELGTRVASGQLNLDACMAGDNDELYERLLEIKGIGPYAAGNILKLLGHYDFLALDSWCRQRFSQLYRAGKKVSDKTIARKYSRYGSWQGLVMWLELTREWFETTEE